MQISLIKWHVKEKERCLYCYADAVLYKLLSPLRLPYIIRYGKNDAGGGLFKVKKNFEGAGICQQGGMFMRRVFASLLFLLFISSVLMAYQLSPLNVTYAPSGADSAKVYTITNDSDSPVAIEVRAEQRIIDIDGNEVNQDGSAYFSIQPSRMIIPGNTTQLVRVQYRGPQTVTSEMSFRIISEQIPMPQGAQDQEAGQMISFLFVYSTSAYVRPSRVIESVSESVEYTDDGKLEIIIENTGSVHQMLNSLEITLHGDDGSIYTLTEDELAPISGKNLLTDSRLRTIIDIPESLSGADEITADVSYDFSYSN